MDDNLEILSDRYAKGLYVSAKENNTIDQLMREFSSFDQLWRGDANLRLFLLHELITRQEKKAVIERLIVKGPDTVVLLNFLKLIIDNHRSELLPEIFLIFRNLYDEGKNLQRVIVENAQALTAVQKKQLEKALHAKLGKDILLDERTRPDLLSGVHVRYGNNMFDNSLKAKLDGLKEVLT